MGTTKKGRFCNNYPYKYGDGYCRVHADPDVIKINKEDETEKILAKKKKSDSKLNKEALENRLDQDRINKLQRELDSLIVMIGIHCNLKDKDIRKLDGKMYFLKIYNAGYYEVEGETIDSFESKGVEEDRNIMLQLVADLIGYQKPKGITPEAMYQELLTITLKTFYLKKQREKPIWNSPNARDVYNKHLKKEEIKHDKESRERKKKERESKTEEEIIKSKKVKCNKLLREIRVKYNCPLPKKLQYMGDIELEREFILEYAEIEALKLDIGGYPEEIIVPIKKEWELHNEKQDYHSDSTVKIMMDPNRERDKGVMIRDRLLKSNHDVKEYNNLPREYFEEKVYQYCNEDDDEDKDDECGGTRIVPHTNQRLEDVQSEPSDKDLQPFLHWTAPQKSKIEGRDYIMKHDLKICTELIGDYNNFMTKCRELNCSPLKYLYMFEKFVFDYDKP
uniref:Uncharacterized protein n=1 Tax=Pithovirus LCPAC406 TaxID=2506599 RepID=A0A481ZEH4_9VIRU|nr:MAG: uncharacterized protein LCPAC406_01190 [Pithovirus LCPAC406]